mgnify:CR=1 FL=1
MNAQLLHRQIVGTTVEVVGRALHGPRIGVLGGFQLVLQRPLHALEQRVKTGLLYAIHADNLQFGRREIRDLPDIGRLGDYGGVSSSAAVAAPSNKNIDYAPTAPDAPASRWLCWRYASSATAR